MKQLLSFLMLLVSVTASAQEFTYTYEGQTLNYRVVSNTNWAKTCIVAENSSLEGALVIPEKVLYENSEYSVSYIGKMAFKNCSGLTSIDIPNSVTFIGEKSFEACNGLTSIYSLNPIPPTVGNNYYWEKHCFDNTNYQNAMLYVPQEALEAYRTAEIWKNFKNIVGVNPTGITDVNAADNNADRIYYDMNGRRLNTPIKGLNIVNGKKVIIK